jgi:hypothetical protein
MVSLGVMIKAMTGTSRDFFIYYRKLPVDERCIKQIPEYIPEL